MKFLPRSARPIVCLPVLFSLLGALLTIVAMHPVARAQEGALDKSLPKGTTVEEIIKRFAAKEKEFKEARDQYTFRQDVKVMTLDGDTPDGSYQQVFDVTFDDKGHKVKNVVFAPQNTLQRILMTEEDLDDIENRLPFVLTSDEVGEYDVLYVGQQKQDELDTYVFDIAPKQIVGKKRYFQGRIWVDNHDFQVVETYGKTVPDIRKKKGQENLFPNLYASRGHAEVFHGRYQDPRDRQVHKLPAFRIEIQDPLRRQGSAEGGAEAGRAGGAGATQAAVGTRFQGFRVSRFQSAEPSGQAVFLLNELSSRSNKPSTWYDSRSSASYAGRSMKPRSSAIASCVSASSKEPRAWPKKCLNSPEVSLPCPSAMLGATETEALRI